MSDNWTDHDVNHRQPAPTRADDYGRSPLSAFASGAAVSTPLSIAARQCGIVIASLMLLWFAASRARPIDAADRDLISGPFKWAIALWIVLLVFNALAFRHSQIHRIENMPLLVGIAAGLASIAIGLASLDSGEFVRRLAFLILHGCGVGLLWWAISGLGVLLYTRATNTEFAVD